MLHSKANITWNSIIFPYKIIYNYQTKTPFVHGRGSCQKLIFVFSFSSITSKPNYSNGVTYRLSLLLFLYARAIKILSLKFRQYKTKHLFLNFQNLFFTNTSLFLLWFNQMAVLNFSKKNLYFLSFFFTVRWFSSRLFGVAESWLFLGASCVGFERFLLGF